MIDIEWRGTTAIVRLGHGKVNAMDVELLAALNDCIGELTAADGAAVVVTGCGKAFSAGVDLRRLLAEGAPYADELVPALAAAFTAWFAAPLPVIAAVNGHAIAGGCILAATADRRLMAAGDAKIGASELVVGVPFPYSVVEILRHACGPHADEVVLTGRLYDPVDACRVGLIHEVVAPDELLDRALETAEELGALARDGYALAKSQLRSPTLQRIERNPGADKEVARIWRRDETAERIRQALERTVRSGKS